MRKMSLLIIVSGVFSLAVMAGESEVNGSQIYNRSADKSWNQEIDIQKQKEDVVKQREKFRKEIERRQKKMESLNAAIDKTLAGEADLNARIAALKTQPEDTENLKKQDKLIKQLNRLIEKRRKIQSNIDEEASKIESASHELSIYESMPVDNNEGAVVESDSVVGEVQPADTSSRLPVLSELSNKLEKPLSPYVAADDGRGLIVGGNLIVGNNNVVIVVDDRQKAEEIAGLLRGGNRVSYRLSPHRPVEERDVFYRPFREKEYGDNNVEKAGDVFGESFFKHSALGFKVSTMGLGAEFATTLSRNLQFRIGYDWLVHDFRKMANFKIHDPAVNRATGAVVDPKLRSDLDFNYGNYHALIDLYPFRRGIIHLTAGVYYGRSEIKVAGQIVDGYNGSPLQLLEGHRWPDLYFADYKAPVENGYVTTNIKFENRWKPYLGVGLGRAVSRSPVSFKLELGLLYQGEYEFWLNDDELPTSEHADSFVKQANYRRWLKFYPVASFQMNIRIW
jgi:chaperonin cofactor prefoldin